MKLFLLMMTLCVSFTEMKIISSALCSSEELSNEIKEKIKKEETGILGTVPGPVKGEEVICGIRRNNSMKELGYSYHTVKIPITREENVNGFYLPDINAWTARNREYDTLRSDLSDAGVKFLDKKPESSQDMQKLPLSNSTSPSSSENTSADSSPKSVNAEQKSEQSEDIIGEKDLKDLQTYVEQLKEFQKTLNDSFGLADEEKVKNVCQYKDNIQKVYNNLGKVLKAKDEEIINLKNDFKNTKANISDFVKYMNDRMNKLGEILGSCQNRECFFNLFGKKEANVIEKAKKKLKEVKTYITEYKSKLGVNN